MWRSTASGHVRGVQVFGMVGRQEGSLLLWSWLLATYSSVAIFTNRRKLRDVMPYVTAILMTTQTFFLILNAFVVSHSACWPRTARLPRSPTGKV